MFDYTRTTWAGGTNEGLDNDIDQGATPTLTAPQFTKLKTSLCILTFINDYGLAGNVDAGSVSKIA